jgi:hypothetical protein
LARLGKVFQNFGLITNYKNTKLRYMYWNWINVFNHEKFIGSFYTDKSKREEVVKEINEKYGQGQWTRFTSE